jgi:polar amino acid transport system permease protein
MTATTEFAEIHANASPPAPKTGHAHYRIVPARHPARTVGTIFSAVVIAAVLHSILTNPKWGWGVFPEWFFAAPVLEGLERTLLLTALAAVFGFLLGGALALARVSGSPLLAFLCWSYICCRALVHCSCSTTLAISMRRS